MAKKKFCAGKRTGVSDEVCWLSESVDRPRIAHPPFDLLLACEMVAANFFTSEYQHSWASLRLPTQVGSFRIWRTTTKAFCHRSGM